MTYRRNMYIKRKKEKETIDRKRERLRERQDDVIRGGKKKRNI